MKNYNGHPYTRITDLRDFVIGAVIHLRALGWTDAQIGEGCGTCRSAVTKWVGGYCLPSEHNRDRLFAIAAANGYPVPTLREVEALSNGDGDPTDEAMMVVRCTGAAHAAAEAGDRARALKLIHEGERWMAGMRQEVRL